jgi:hypothetical protein
MSDSEASDFRFDDSDSDGYVAAPKGKKAPAKKAAATKATKVGGTKVRIHCEALDVFRLMLTASCRLQ